MGEPSKQELKDRIEALQSSLDEAHGILSDALGYEDEDEDEIEQEEDAEDDEVD